MRLRKIVTTETESNNAPAFPLEYSFKMHAVSITQLWLCLGIPEVSGEVVNFSFISVAAIKYLDKSKCWDKWFILAHNSRL